MVAVVLAIGECHAVVKAQPTQTMRLFHALEQDIYSLTYRFVFLLGVRQLLVQGVVAIGADKLEGYVPPCIVKYLAEGLVVFRSRCF